MNDAQATRLGRLLARARKQKGIALQGKTLTFRDVEELSGVPFLWIYRLEHGEFHQPDSARLTKLAEALDIDPEQIDRITQGQVSNSLPGVRTYFRAKYDLTPGEIDRIERTVAEIERSHEDERP